MIFDNDHGARALVSECSSATAGDILIRGNGLLTCPTSAPLCAAAQDGTGNPASIDNNDFQMVFVDSDPATRSSSSADVQLPVEVHSAVRRAVLVGVHRR